MIDFIALQSSWMEYLFGGDRGQRQFVFSRGRKHKHKVVVLSGGHHALINKFAWLPRALYFKVQLTQFWKRLNWLKWFVVHQSNKWTACCKPPTLYYYATDAWLAGGEFTKVLLAGVFFSRGNGTQLEHTLSQLWKYKIECLPSQCFSFAKKKHITKLNVKRQL